MQDGNQVPISRAGVGETVQADGEWTVARAVNFAVEYYVVETHLYVRHHVTVATTSGSLAAMAAIDELHYREVVGHFATGVVVVTAFGENGPLGFTCQCFGSLSVDPILVSFAARTSSSSWPQIARIGALAVNVLAADQEALARVFATSGADKFAEVPWQKGVNGAPLLAGALAHLEGMTLSVTTHGDHDIAVVAVEHVESFSGSPLVYYRGTFGSFTR